MTHLRRLAALYPWSVEPSEELAEAVAFVESAHDAETIVRAGYVAGALAALLSTPLLLAPLPLWSSLVAILAASLGVVHAIHSGPHLLAAVRRTRALGDTPALIGRIVLRMQIQPATESAVRFAAETGQGPLASSLGAHVDRAAGTPRSGLLAFATEWADRFPALRRSAHLLAAAENAPDGERSRTLDRAFAAVLDGTRDGMAEFTASIRGPATGLYAFGVMLPLALVALVPAATIAGYPVSIWFFVVVYNVVLPTLLVVAGAWLLVRRPVAFPPPTVTRAHPDVPDRLWKPLVFGLVVGVGAYLVTPALGPAALAPIAATGLALGIALTGVYYPVAAVRQHVRDVEAHLVDALYLVGRQVAEGEAVESAIALAGDRVPAETGDVFADAAGLQRRLHLGVRDAFLGRYGSLADVPSPRAHSTASLLAIAADEGQPAGRAVVSMADHLEELQEVERETRRELATVTGTLDNTASFFGPMVAGATVALAGGIVGSGAEAADATTLPTDALGLVVGVYVLTLAVVLTTISIGLRHGLDRSLVGYRVGRALSVATPIYVCSVIVASTFV
ncbi:secretion system protein [Natribaculum luteum]|uniref:Secretion system protein n=1 Tax=Natribaculum luteum TaxID=1586232 RepID=A0ABD5NXR3_9EURY|nr:secretion system protein [Natribaculum luteum]